MKAHCPKDGGFIGAGGCTHPHHVHSPLVAGLLAAKSPRMITAEECDTALDEGFYVTSKEGRKVAFGKRLKGHLDEHKTTTGEIDANARKALLSYAVHAVKTTKAEVNHKGLEGRRAYIFSNEKVGALILTDKTGAVIDDVFNIIPKRSLRNKPERGGL